MKERIYRVLNIKPSESSQVFDLLTVQFFIGLANALVNIIAFTLFVYNFPVDSLPYVYLAIAGLLILINFVYEKLEHKFSPISLLKYIIIFSGITLIVLWLGLTFGNEGDFIFALIVASVLLYMLNSYAFWGLVSILFNVRESRRVFSIVGSGDIPAKLIGYIAAPLFIPLVGLNNVVWLGIASLAFSFYLFNRFTRKQTWDAVKLKSHLKHESHNVVLVESKKKDFVSFVFKEKLIFAISLLSILSYNVFVLVDFTFISQIKLRFENITDLAAYIAVFFAFGRLIALTFKLIFTSRVIERLGVIYCLFVTPIALFIFCIVFIVYQGHSNYNLFIFGLMAMFTEVLRSTMQEPVFFILFQPLKENLRLKGHMISKGYMYPPSLIIVGVSLLFLYRSGTDITILLVVKILLVNLCIWVATIFFIRSAYFQTIHTSIKKGIFSSDDIYVTDQLTINILLQKIKAGKKTEVIYALDLLEKAGYQNFIELLSQQLLETKNTDVRKYVLDRFEVSGKVNIDILHRLLLQEEDADLRQKIVSLLCKHDQDYLYEASRNLNGYETGVRKTIVIHLLNQKEFDFLFQAGKEINQMLNSAEPAERELALEVISELKNIKFSQAISQLINDPETAVKRVAIMTACKLKMKALLPVILERLDHVTDRNIVLKGLQLYGDSLFEDYDSFPEQHCSDFIKISARMKGSYSTDFLLSMLTERGTVYKDKIVHALWVKEYLPNTSEEKLFLSHLLHSYLKEGSSKVLDYKSMHSFHDKCLVQSAVFSEVKNDLLLALKTCVMLFNKKELNRILEILTTSKHEKLYNAMEMLELLLSNKISKELNLLFDFILDPSHAESTVVSPAINEFFSKVIFEIPHQFNSWTKALCIYCAWKNNDEEFINKLSFNVVADDDYLVTQTLEFVNSKPKHIAL